MTEISSLVQLLALLESTGIHPNRENSRVLSKHGGGSFCYCFKVIDHLPTFSIPWKMIELGQFKIKFNFFPQTIVMGNTLKRDN